MAPPEAPNTTAIISDSQYERASIVHWITLLLIVVTGVAVRLECLACKPFWFDECFSVEVARIDWRNFLHLLWWREANMSLYYVLLRFWLHFGQSSFFIRSLLVVISACSLLAIYWLGCLLYDRRVGLSAAALLAVNAYEIRYAQEARSYTLFVLLATLSSGFLISWLRKPTRSHWRGYAIASILAVYAHFYALLLLVAHWLVLRWVGRPQQDSRDDGNTATSTRELQRAWIVIGIGVLPLLIFVAKTGAGPIRWIQRPSIPEFLQFSSFFTNGFPVVYLLACLAALIPLKKDQMAKDGKWEIFRVQFLCVWFLFPILLTILLSFARPVFLPRYMIFCLPAMLILAAAGIASVPRKWASALLIGAVLLLSARMIPYVYSHDFDDERDASGVATNLILEHTQPGDAIIFHIAEARVPYEFFRSLRAHENTASANFITTLGPEIVFPHHGPELDYHDFTGKPTSEFLRTALLGHSRVWVMLMNNGGIEKPDPTTVMLTQILPETFPKMERWQFTRVEVRLYSK
jgi:mannosyltransferase